MIIILLIEFGINIALLVVFLKIKYKYEFTKNEKNIIKDIKEKSKYCSYYYNGYCDYDHYDFLLYENLEKRVFLNQTNSIISIFSLFFFFFVIFIIKFIVYFKTNGENRKKCFCEFNHLLTIVSFIICQILYLIDCIFLPISFLRILKIQNKYFYPDFDSIKKRYIILIQFSTLFLIIILFVEFILLNLYKGICCDMDIICKQFKNSFINCCSGIKDILKCKCLKNNNNIDNGSEQMKQIYNLTGEIRYLLAENLELRIKNININSDISIKSENKLNEEKSGQIGQDIKSTKKEIDKFKDNIKKLVENIKEEDKEKREIICKLREIMENPSNHVDKLISNKLTTQQENLYKEEINKLNQLINNNISGTYKNSIKSEREKIENMKKVLKSNEKSNRENEDKKIEKQRQEIIKLNIDYLREHKINEEVLNYLNNTLNNNTSSNKI